MDGVPCLALSPLSPLVPPRAHAEAAALLAQFCADITAEDRARTKGRLAAALGWTSIRTAHVTFSPSDSASGLPPRIPEKLRNRFDLDEDDIDAQCDTLREALLYKARKG